MHGRGHFGLYLSPNKEELCIKSFKNAQIFKAKIFDFFVYCMLVNGKKKYLSKFKAGLMFI